CRNKTTEFSREFDAPEFCCTRLPVGKAPQPMQETVRRRLALSQERKRECRMRVLLATKRFLQDESGATAIEYGLIAAGISVAIIGALTATSGKLTSTFTAVQNALK